jgi:hypothetical protein
MDNQMMVNITRYAKQYRDKYLSKLYDADVLRNHWWNSYQFLAFSIYNQGIFEKINNAIRNMAETAISEHLDMESPDGVTKATDKQISDAMLTFMSMRINGKTYKRKQDVELREFSTISEDSHEETSSNIASLRLRKADSLSYISHFEHSVALVTEQQHPF